MSHNYYISTVPNDRNLHEVHKGHCVFLPRTEVDCITLGTYEDCSDAIAASKNYFKNTEACLFCSYDYHINGHIKTYEKSNSGI